MLLRVTKMGQYDQCLPSSQQGPEGMLCQQKGLQNQHSSSCHTSEGASGQQVVLKLQDGH